MDVVPEKELSVISGTGGRCAGLAGEETMGNESLQRLEQLCMATNQLGTFIFKAYLRRLKLEADWLLYIAPPHSIYVLVNPLHSVPDAQESQ